MRLELDGHLSRDSAARLSVLLAEEPAVLVTGPRGSGKSTLLREIAVCSGAVHLDLDDERVLSAIQQDPSAALSHDSLVVLDEFQRAPAALSVVKRLVDRQSGPGRFLLAGSVSAPLLPTGAETLTGRVHRMVLPPLSAAELLHGAGRLLPRLLTAPEPPAVLSQLTRADYFAMIAAGGYPAALSRTSTSSRSRWHNSYRSSVSERDLPDLVAIRHPGALARLYRKIAQETATIQIRSRLGEDLGLSATTARSYFDLLQHVFLISELPGWTMGVSAKPGRRPKVHVTDTGLAASAL
ncbi:MAG: ATP-binding protein, partial [Angustibacter sp.]